MDKFTSSPFPEGMILTKTENFVIPIGYKVWCHKCGRPPYNIVTNGVPGMGFESIEESQKHEKDVHGKER